MHGLEMDLQKKESRSGREGQVFSRQRETQVRKRGGMDQPGVYRGLWRVGHLVGGARGWAQKAHLDRGGSPML